MRLSKLKAILLLACISGSALSEEPKVGGSSNRDLFVFEKSDAGDLIRSGILSSPLEPERREEFESGSSVPQHHVIKTPTNGGIREEIAGKYRDRYERWKTELTSTEFGRRQWATYADNKNFILTIKINSDVGKGAGTGDYLWNEEGLFVGATITLGDDLDRGFPSPVYYPVMNSLSAQAESFSLNPKILAAAKLAHEIGHVDQTAKANGEFMRLQDRLMPVYNSIFLKNGLKVSDKKLIDLATQMGGTPIEIWESREYGSELEAMAFLQERLSKEDFYCRVFTKIRQNVKDYARDHEKDFEKSSAFTASPCWN